MLVRFRRTPHDSAQKGCQEDLGSRDLCLEDSQLSEQLRPLLVRCASYSNTVGSTDGEGCGPFSPGILSKTSTMKFHQKTKKSQAYGPLVGESAR